MMQKIQRFGGAMFTPVLLFAFAGVIIGISTLCTTEIIIGDLAKEGTLWHGFWNMLLSGGWTVFNQLPLLFAVSLPIGLAKKQNARACMEALVLYLTFNYFLSTILEQWGSSFGVDFASEVGGSSGLAMIANIKTLDMGMMGALLISGISIFIHNKFFDKSLPEWLGVFQGSTFVVGIGFFIMIPMAFLAALVWPKVQNGMEIFQHYVLSTGAVGVWVFVLLERLLIPFGLHHLMYAPFFYDNVVVNGGIYSAWAKMLPELAASTKDLKELAPFAAYTATGWSKIFGCVGIGMAFYKTANEQRKKEVLGLVIPIVLTAVLCGVTEPIEFTFLFIAPLLFAVHAILAASLSTIMYLFGVVGVFSGGAIEMASLNWIPLMANHASTYLKMLIIGIIAIFVWYFVFRFLILKFDFKTPGREIESEEVKFYSKKEFREKNASNQQKNEKVSKQSLNAKKAKDILHGLGGADNIEDFTNCVTRLRVNVKDPSKILDDSYFREIKTHGTSRNGKSIHVIVGMTIQQVADEFSKLL